MPVGYKIDILAALKAAGYSSTRIRNEKLMGQATLQQLRHGELVSWMNIATICKLLQCQPGDILEYTEEKDGEADESAICEWGKYTDNDFDYRIFPGGHFYLRDYEDEVISEVERRLQGMKNGG